MQKCDRKSVLQGTGSCFNKPSETWATLLGLMLVWWFWPSSCPRLLSSWDLKSLPKVLCSETMLLCWRHFILRNFLIKSKMQHIVWIWPAYSLLPLNSLSDWGWCPSYCLCRLSWQKNVASTGIIRKKMRIWYLVSRWSRCSLCVMPLIPLLSWISVLHKSWSGIQGLYTLVLNRVFTHRI